MDTRTYAQEQIDKGFKDLGLPSYMKSGVELWVLNGIPAGSFLMAVMENNLMGAFSQADDNNTAMMRDWACLLYNYLPGGCHGSREKVKAWADLYGINGKGEEAQKEASCG